MQYHIGLIYMKCNRPTLVIFLCIIEEGPVVITRACNLKTIIMIIIMTIICSSSKNGTLGKFHFSQIQFSTTLWSPIKMKLMPLNEWNCLNLMPQVSS